VYEHHIQWYTKYIRRDSYGYTYLECSTYIKEYTYTLRRNTQVRCSTQQCTTQLRCNTKNFPPWGRPIYTLIDLFRNKIYPDAIYLICVASCRDSAFRSRSGTSSCVRVRFSLLVCILILTTFPEPLASVMAFTQWTLVLRQLYTFYRMYNTRSDKQTYTRTEYVLCEAVCSRFRSCSLIICSTSENLLLAIFRSSK
jgi:hypothetical protein